MSKPGSKSPARYVGAHPQAIPPREPKTNHLPVASLHNDLLLLIAINFMWALKWTLSKVALRQLDPVSITLFPMIGALILLLPVMRKALKGQPVYLGIIRREASRPANLLRFLVLGVFGQVACQVLISWGLKYVSATDAALIGLCTPILMAILAIVMVGEVLTGRLIMSFIFAVAGVLLIIGVNIHGAGGSLRYYLFGVLLLLASGLGAAFYNAYSKKLLDRFLPAEILFYSYIFVVLSLYPLHRVTGHPLSLDKIAGWHWQIWCCLALLSVLVYWLSMVLFFDVLTRRPLAPISVSIYLMTIFGVLISTVTLHGPLTVNMIIGGLLVFFGAIFASAHHQRAAG